MATFAGISADEIIDTAQALTGPVMIKGQQAAYTFDGITATQISDADYPSITTRGLQYLDGTFYVMEPDGTIHNSDPASDDPTVWPSDGTINAEFEPDQGVRLGKAFNYLVALGQWTTELFWNGNTGATGSPLLPVQNGVLLIGCASAGSVAQTESTLIWMAQRKAEGSFAQKGRFIAIMVGTSYKEVSTPDISRVLEADDLSQVYAVILELAGHTWYLLTLGSSGITLVLDLKTQDWYVWTRLAVGSPLSVTSLTQTNGLASAVVTNTMSDGDPVVVSGATPAGYNGTLNASVANGAGFTYPVTSTLAGTASGTIVATPYTEAAMYLISSLNFGGLQLVMDTSGNVYNMTMATALDNGDIPINLRIRTRARNDGNNLRKFCSDVSVFGDIVGTATGLLRASDDDYQSYSYFRRFDLSQVLVNQHRWGSYRRRAWEWRYTGAVRHRIQSLNPDLEQGRS